MAIVETLVSDIQRILETLRVKHGPFVLAMLYSSFESGDWGWNLIVSAPWTDQLGEADSIRAIAHELHLQLSLENRASISRVTVLPTNEPFVTELTSLYPVASPGATSYLTNVSFAGIDVPRGIVFYSDKSPMSPMPAHR